jgi:hypothetical protein
VAGRATGTLTPARVAAAVGAGLVLAALPFLHYASFGPAAAAHADHEARYGGQLGMVDDHHIELRRRNGLVEAFVSDARRGGVQPRAGWVVFDRRGREPLRWNGHHLIGTDQREARETEVIVVVDDRRLALSFDWSP